MKKVILKSIELNNFKGVKHFSANLNNKETTIVGDNGVGKTSIIDAISWAFEGKNSQGRADFNIKSLDSNNEFIPDIKHSVELAFDVGGIERKIKRIYYEKIQKIKGEGKDSARSTGHTTDFEVDSISKNKSEYEKAVSEIMGVSKEEYAMLSNPLYFIERMHWEKRRAILCTIAGDVTYEDVIIDPAFKNLKIELSKHKPEEYKTHCNSQSLGLTKQLSENRARIDENDLSKKNLSSIDFESIEKEITQKEAEIRSLEDKYKTINDNSANDAILLEYSEKINKIMQGKADLEKQLHENKSAKQKKIDEKVAESQKLIDSKYSILEGEKLKGSTLKNQHDNISTSLAECENEVNGLNVYLQSLRDAGNAIKERKFVFEETATCPACMRDFTSEDLESKKAIAKKAFDEKVIAEFSETREKGIATGARVKKINEDIAILNNQSSSIWNQVLIKKEVVENLQSELDALNSEKYKCDTSLFDKKSEEILAAIEIFDKKIIDAEKEKEIKLSENTSTSVIAAKNEILESIEGVKKSIGVLRETLSGKGTLKDIDKRISELKQKEKTICKDAEHWEEQKFLTQKLMDAYASKVEESVNKLFSLVKFKLFNKLQNGGTESICEVLLNGVPDGDINQAGRVNAGIDVINTLSRHYGIIAPIVIDNRESVTKLEKTECQVINLFKKEGVKTLTLSE